MVRRMFWAAGGPCASEGRLKTPKKLQQWRRARGQVRKDYSCIWDRGRERNKKTTPEKIQDRLGGGKEREDTSNALGLIGSPDYRLGKKGV